MTIITVAAVVGAIALVILTIVVVRTSIEVNKTAITARNFIDHVEVDIKPVIMDLHETLGNLKVISEGAAEKLDDMKSFMEAAGDTGRNLHTINSVVSNVTGIVGKSSLWMTGLKAAGRFMLNRYIKKRG